MAQTYTRQSTFADGDTITAALFNDEYNQLVNAFTYSSSSASSTGHRHDGTAGQGGNIHTIGDLDFLNKIVVDSTNNRWGFYVEVSSSAVEQIRIQDGAIVPVTDNDIDLGTSSLEFKDAYFDGTVTTDALVADTADINGGTVDGAIIGGSSAAAITGTTITGTSFVIGSADISEAELETIDGVTAGTVAASKAVVVDSNKDIASFRNVTLTGELDAATLDISGDADIDGTLEADAITIGGVTLAETISDTVGAMVSSNTETNITVTYDDSDNTLDFVIGTLNQDTTGTAALATEVTVSANNSTDETIFPVFVDGATGSQGLETDTGFTYNPSSGNLTIGGSLTAATLDISGDVDVDGTLEADAITVNGTTLAETISDTVGAMVSSNTETNITVTYDDSDNTLDFVIGTLNQDTTGNAATATALETARTIHGVSFDGTANIDLSEVVQDTVGAMFSSNTETGITATYQDGDGTIDLVVGTLNQDTTGNAATATALETARTIHGVSFDGTANIDLSEVIQDTVGAMVSSNTESGITVAYEDSDGTLDFTVGTLNQDTTGNAATATALETARTIHGVSFDGTGNIDLTEVIQDTVGAMVSSNTESGITVAYQDADGTLDFTVTGGVVNQVIDADADTKIQVEESSDEDTIRMDVAGTEVLTLTNSAMTLKGTTPTLTIGDAGAEDTKIVFDGNAQDYYIGLDDSADTLVIGNGSTLGTEAAITIDSSEKVGLNGLLAGDYWATSNQLVLGNTTSSANGGMTIATASDAVGQIYFADGTSGDAQYRGQIQYTHVSDAMDFATAASFAMRITSGGDVAIGGTSSDPLSLAFSGTGLTINEDSGVAYFQIDGGNTARIDFGQGGTRNFNIYSDASNYSEIKRTTNHPILFGTNNAERMRIDGGGSIFFQKTSHSFATGGVEFLSANIVNMTRSGGTVLNVHRTSSDGTMVEFFKDSGQVGSISTNANSLPSDRNFKRDISDLDLGLDLITKLKPSQYNYKLDDENSPKMYGLIAQDLEESLTEVGVEKNSTWLLQHNPKDDEKQSDYALDYLKLTPVLIKAIQEQQEQIEALQSEINTLKGGE